MSALSEIWAPVVGYEGVYDVSADGKVMRVAGGRKGATPGRVLRPSPTSDGYPSVPLAGGSPGSRSHMIHTLVARAFLGPRPEGHQINHIDGVKDNNRLDNLEYVTPKQNIAHARRLGLVKFPCGIALQMARLTEDQVREIRRRRPHENAKQIADEFGISAAHVYGICNGNGRKGVI